MADIDILVNSSQVKTAKQELQELGNSFNSASKSASIFMQAFERAAKQSQRDEQYIRQTSQALQRLINDNLKITNAYKSAEQSASAFTEGLRKQEAQALKTAQANQAAINKQLGVGGPSATSGGAGFAAMDAEIERLRQKYDQVYSASRLYESSLNELNRAHMLGVTSTKQHESAVEQLNFEYQQFSNSTQGAVLANNRFSQHVNESGRGLNQFGLYAQQVGYQVGDFFVQIQSGTNVLVAFGQQATQLAGLFPGVLGAALGIGISLTTAIGAAFMRIKENAESAANGVLSLADAQKQLNEVAGDYALKLEMLRFGVDTQAEAVALREILGLTGQIQSLSREYEQTDSLSARQRLAEEIQALKVQLSTQQAIVDKVNEKRAAYEKAITKAESLRDRALEALGHMKAMAATDLSSAFAKAMPAAQNFLDKLREMASAYATYGPGNVIPGTATPYGRFTEGGMDAAARGQMLDRPNPFGTLAGGAAGVFTETGAGGGGGAGTTTLENKMEEIYKYLELDKYLVEQETIAFEQRQEVLRSALENKMLTLQEYNELEKALALQHQQDLANIEGNAQQQRLSDTANMFGQLANIASVGGQKTVKVVAAFQAVEGTINAYGAAIKALNTPGITLAGRFAAYASVLAAGLKGVMAIRSAGGVGGGASGGVGGSPGSATVAQPAAPATPQTVLISGLDPNALFTGEQLSRLFENFYKENDNRGKVFVVAR